MKIGKTVKIVTSPPRKTQKAQPIEFPVPVKLPEKVETGEKNESRI